MGLTTARSERKSWREVGVDDLKAWGENALATGPFGSSVGSQFFQTDGVPLIRGSNLTDDGKTHLVDEGFVFLSEKKAAEFGRSTVVKGDLIFTCWGTINQVGLISEHATYPRYIISNKQMKFTPDPLKADSLFLFYLFSAAEIQRQIRIQSIGTSVPGFNLGRLRALRFRVPDLLEQRAIAAALSDVDGLLGGLDRLIAKKRDLKQAAMQQLLTGRTRLPGFHGEWEEKRLGEDITLLSGHHVLAQHCNTQSQGVPYLTGPADFPEGRIQHTKFTDRPGTLCSPNDILVTVKGSGTGTIVLADAEYCISRQLMAIRLGEWDVRFIYFSLLQNAAQFKAASTGLIPGLSRSDILDQPLPLPPTIPEQTAIASVLTDMDAELAALEQRREKTRALKQAMMQELLTGRTRLL